MKKIIKKLIKIGKDIFKIIFLSKAIKSGIREIAIRIVADYPDPNDPPVLLYVATGGIFLGVDMSRALEKLNLRHQVDIVRIDGYDTDDLQKDEPEITCKPKTSLRGRKVIVIEDLVDSGDSLILLNKFLKRLGIQSLQYCVLFLKKGHKPLGFPIKYVVLPTDLKLGWVVGMGMDSNGFGRGRTDISEKIEK